MLAGDKAGLSDMMMRFFLQPLEDPQKALSFVAV